MRGKPAWSWAQAALRRITPADAGKTYAPAPPQVQHRDHPRGCGENSAIERNNKQNTGSPPRMRGKHIFCSPSGTELRITPADAGKTRHTRRRDRARQDHPRGCGENLKRRPNCQRNTGSPPRMRGKPNGANRIFTLDRITPADAGKTGSVCIFSR